MLKYVIPALAALSLGASAQAKEPGGMVVTVAYADLNLASSAGAATLQGRIDRAVKEVCARPFIRDLKAMAAWDKCRADALKDANDQVSEAHVAAPQVALAR